MPKKAKIVRVAIARDERPASFRGSYRTEYTAIAARLAMRGETNEAIARILGVSRRTFYYWLATYPKLREAMERPKEIADARVEMALYGNALGYEYEEEEVKIIDGKPVKVTVMKWKPPETIAQLAWLNNRQPGQWQRNRSADGDLPPPPEAPTDDDITPANAREIARRFALTIYKGAMN